MTVVLDSWAVLRLLGGTEPGASGVTRRTGSAVPGASVGLPPRTVWILVRRGQWRCAGRRRGRTRPKRPGPEHPDPVDVQDGATWLRRARSRWIKGDHGAWLPVGDEVRGGERHQDPAALRSQQFEAGLPRLVLPTPASPRTVTSSGRSPWSNAVRNAASSVSRPTTVSKIVLLAVPVRPGTLADPRPTGCVSGWATNAGAASAPPR